MGINSTKALQDLYSEKIQKLLKGIKEDLNKSKADPAKNILSLYNP